MVSPLAQIPLTDWQEAKGDAGFSMTDVGRFDEETQEKCDMPRAFTQAIVAIALSARYVPERWGADPMVTLRFE